MVTIIERVSRKRDRRGTLKQISKEERGCRRKYMILEYGDSAKFLYTDVEHHSVCPLVGIGTPPTPLPQASVPSPPSDQRVGRGTLACGRGDGGDPIPTTVEKA